MSSVRRHWSSLLLAVLGLLAVGYWLAARAGQRGVGEASYGAPGPIGSVSPALPASPPPVVAPVEYLPVTPEQAVVINANPTVPVDPGPAARPFGLGPLKDPPTAAVECLTSAIYYEAANEATDGQRAVAQVVLNRLRNPAFPSSVCGVVYQGSERVTGCQFSFTCDGSLRRTPSAGGWQRAQRVANEALQGKVFAPVGNATHYHANYVVPYWASSLNRSATIGAHIFYRWKGGWGEPRAFAKRYSGDEPAVGSMLAKTVPGGVPLAPVPVLTDERLVPVTTVLAEDLKVDAGRKATGKPAAKLVLKADTESGGLIASLRAKPVLEADRVKLTLNPGVLTTRPGAKDERSTRYAQRREIRQ